MSRLKSRVGLSVLFFVGFVWSARVFADETVPVVSLKTNPQQAQEVPTEGVNPQMLALNEQARRQNEATALSHGQTYVTTAPDPHIAGYWSQKNTSLPDTVPVAPIAQAQSQPIDQARLEKESEGLKNILTQWQAQKPAFQSVQFDTQVDSLNAPKTSPAFHSVTALPGTLWYATMASGADSYVPGVVRVQLQEGPFAGGYALGKFQIAPDGQHLILTFQTVSLGQSSFSITAVALDPHAQIPGVTGEIDHHFMTRYVLPGAMGFLQGAVELLKANTTVVMNGTTSALSGPHLSNAQLGLLMASSAADRLQDATTPQGVLKLPEVKIAPGTGVGFLLLKSL